MGLQGQYLGFFRSPVDDLGVFRPFIGDNFLFWGGGSPIGDSWVFGSPVGYNIGDFRSPIDDFGCFGSPIDDWAFLGHSSVMIGVFLGGHPIVHTSVFGSFIDNFCFFGGHSLAIFVFCGSLLVDTGLVLGHPLAIFGFGVACG